MEKDKPTKQREEVRKLSDIELFDELQRPTDNWKEDVIRETLSRILGRLISDGIKSRNTK